MDLKTSLLVNRQVPSFVREEYPLFVSFLEAYYEFLETNENVLDESKKLKDVNDLDISLEKFEENFFNYIALYLPTNTEVDKTFLLKNVLPLYRTKGTLKSFEFLFKLLFNEDIKAEYPKNNVLRASDGKWVIENILRTNLQTYNLYASDGIKKEYLLPYVLESTDILVRIDDVVTENYVFKKELKKIVFNTAPAEDSVIKIEYLIIINSDIFINRRLKGKTSGATALVENVARRNIGGKNFFQFFINNRTKFGNFTTGELIEIDIVVNDTIIPFEFRSLSEVENLTIVSSGSGYRVGDSINFIGESDSNAIAVVSEVSSGNIHSVFVNLTNNGFGYKINDLVSANGYSSANFNAKIDFVDTSGQFSPNTFITNFDVISPYENVAINAANYEFSPGTTNVNSVINSVLNYSITTNIGPVINVQVTTSTLTNNLTLDLVSQNELLNYGSIASIDINEGGTGYSVGDRIVFKNNRLYFSGQGANAYVSKVNTTGSIEKITVVNGGYNYKKTNLPKILVTSAGSGANLEVGYFLGEGLQLTHNTGDGIDGKVLKVELLSRGSGYQYDPLPSLSHLGDGNASITANLTQSYISLPGRWITTDGLLSSDEMRLQGKDYYVDYSYIITSKVEFQRYKDIVKNLLNPTGFINYARYDLQDSINLPFDFAVSANITRELAGLVSASNGDYFLYGVNTEFVLANTIGLIGEGTYIIVNSDIRIVNGIINSSTITVSEPFSGDISNDIITIFVPDYNGITTEYWREISTMGQNNQFIVLETEG